MPYTLYCWDDPGAPAPLNGLSNANTLINVLDACLVTGYGAKAPAGWSKPFTAANQAAFRQGAGSHGFYLHLDASPLWHDKVRGYESMTAIDAGTNPFPTVAQRSDLVAGRSSSSDGSGRPWLVAADARRFFLWTNANGNLAQGLGTTMHQPTLFFGDLESPNAGDVFNTLISGGISNLNSTYLGYAQNNASNAEYMARNFAGAVGSVAVMKGTHIPYQSTAYIGAVTSAPAFPDPVTGGLLLSPIEVFDVSGFVSRGVLPWIWAPGHNLPGSPGDVLTGVNGPLAGKRLMLLDVAAASSRARIALEIP